MTMDSHQNRSAAAALLAALLFAGCRNAPPAVLPEADGGSTDAPDAGTPEVINGCTGADPADLTRFLACEPGGGIFGKWIVDPQGLPAFDYTFDQRTDPRATWENSEDIAPRNLKRRDHFIVLGNNRLNFLASDEGYVSLYANERGPAWANRFDEEQLNLGGGFSYIGLSGDAFATAYRWAPQTADARRTFGVGYYRTETQSQGVKVARHVVAPEGDDPVLIDEVEITNTSSQTLSFQHWEYWDVNKHQLSIEWARTGLGAKGSNEGRDAINGRFNQSVTWDPAAKVLLAQLTPKPTEAVPPVDAPAGIDFHPAPIFLAALDAPVDGVHADQRTFFGSGTAARPEAVVKATNGAPLNEVNGKGQPACLVMRTDLTLAPGQSRKLRFAYGYLPKGKTLAMLDAHRSGDALAPSLARWKKRLVYADIPGRPLFHREAAWRSHLLLSHTVVNDYYRERYTAQGSAYLYLHGADGVPRDQALFAAGLNLVDPLLAKGNLRMAMAVTDATSGQLAYSFTNFGQVDTATIHSRPSDLDIFLLWSLGEYLAVTGDLNFLDEKVEFYPRGAGHPASVSDNTVLDHARVALTHLRGSVGKGPHGLIRIWDGDWDDGISYEDLSPLAVGFTIQSGESIPNSQMALYALPFLAAVIEGRDPTLATELRTFAASLEQPVRDAFGTRWFGRAWVRNSINQGYLKGNDAQTDAFNSNFIDLQAQPWGVLSGVLAASQRDRLLDEVTARLDAPSPIGPRLREGGQVWPAISQLMTWAWSRHRPELAWRSLDQQLYATHAKVFPEQWVGIWAGPDGFSSTGTGGAWASPVTPMTDFPVNNMNPEAMWLFGLARAAGVEPTPGGLRITPSVHSTVDFPLLRLSTGATGLSGEYRARNPGAITLFVAVPAGSSPQALVNGVSVPANVSAGRLSLPLTFIAGQRIPFEVRY